MSPTRFILLSIIFAIASAGARQVDAAEPKYRYWTTQWSFEDIELATLADRLGRLGIEIPVDLAGTADVNFDVSVPLNALRTGKAYKVSGTLSVRDFRADDLRLENFQADVDYQDGTLILKQLTSTQQNGGSLAGNASVALIPRGKFRSRLKLSDFELKAIAGLLIKAGVLPSDSLQAGAVTADLTAAGPVDKIADPLAWVASGDLTVKRLIVGSMFPIDGTLGDLKLSNRRLEIGSLDLSSPQVESFLVSGNGQVDLSTPKSFDLKLRSNDLPVGDLLRFTADKGPPLIDGKVDLIGTARGRFPEDDSETRLNLDFAVASPQMRVAGVDLGTIEHDLRMTESELHLTPRVEVSDRKLANRNIDSVNAAYRITAENLFLDQIEAGIFGGQLDGSVSFSKQPSGQHQLDLSWSDIAPEVNLRLPLATQTTRLSAETTGQLNWRVPADKLANPAFHRGEATLVLNAIQVAGQRIGQAAVKVMVDGEGLNASGQAEVFGGRASFETKMDVDQQATWDQLPQQLGPTRIELTDISLGETLRLARQQRESLDGLVSGHVDVLLRSATRDDVGVDASVPGAVLTPEISAELELRSLTASGVVVARQLALQATASEGRLRMDSLRGTYAGGQLQAEGDWSATMGGKAIRFRLVGADGDRLFLPLTPAASSWVGGRVTARGTIVGIGQGMLDSIRISGGASVDDGTTFDIPVGDAHSPFVVQLEPKSLRWSADFPAVQSSLAQGRVSGKLGFRSTNGPSDFNMESRWRMTHVDFESLLTTYVGTSTIGQGDVTGELVLEGRRIKGIRDLQGRFQVRLGGTDATAVPGLSAAGALLGVGSLAGTRFNQGLAIGRISRGKVFFEDIAMMSDRVSVHAEGAAGLVDKRLDFDAVVSTGSFEGQDALLQLVGLQSLVSAVPLGEVNQLLSNRTIVFRLTGPMRDPILRLMTAETVRVNARRFAVQEALGVITANSLLWDQ